MKFKIIYLDIDGVMNSWEDAQQISDMGVKKLMLLKRIIKKYRFNGIVITSDRRYSSFDIESKSEAFKNFNINVIGCIRPKKENPDDCRGIQIFDHLINNSNHITDFIIIDDNDDGISDIFKNKFIQIINHRGLTKETMKLIRKKVV